MLTCSVHARRSDPGIIAPWAQDLVQNFLFLFSEVYFAITVQKETSLINVCMYYKTKK